MVKKYGRLYAAPKRDSSFRLAAQRRFFMGQPTDQFQRPLRDLRISVTDRCNFRCPYCMPADVFGESYQFLPRSEILTFEEITRLTRVLVRLGAVKVRLTGGEPLVREEVETL